MYLYPKDKSEYREHLIDPFLIEDKRGEELTVGGFRKYVEELVDFVIKRVESVTGVDLDYDSSTSEEGTAVASILIPGYFGGGISMGPKLTQSLSIEIKLELSLVLVEQILGSIDIEECSDIEAAYIGAYSVLLHEIGHHFDHVEISNLTQELQEAHSDALTPHITTEIICDRIGLLLGKMVMPCLPSRVKQRLFWISRMGLLHGFLVRVGKDLYERNEGLLLNFLREKLEFENATKIKVIGDATRHCIEIALGDVNEQLDDLRLGIGLTEEQIQLTLEVMKQAYRALQKEMLVIQD